MQNYFKKIIGDNPYDYQLKVAEILLSGKNVILSVPTGAGKTWAAVIPFLLAQNKNEIHFPQKMIYSSPLRTLTNSIYEDVSQVVNDASIQTGEYSDDKYFEKNIIFSTIDQTLSNFLCFPLPLSHAQANINAGGLIGSYLVFDEFHLLDPQRSMATTLGMLKMLGSLTRCCIMTATLNDKFMEDLKNNLCNYEIVTLEDFPADKEKIASLLPVKNKKKLSLVHETITAKRIAEKHISKTIVICNKVESAQKLYQDLIELKKNHEKNLRNIKSENIICLHSRFFNDDRKSKENKLKALFGKKCNKEDHAILIATQVIEAGMDLSCNVMHTEISPISSFLQRAGRCARFKNETGEVFVYNILDSEDKIALEAAINDEDKKEIGKINSKYLPYLEPDCNKTFSELKKYQTLDGDIPKKMIENILGESDGELINKMKSEADGSFNQGKIRESWNNCNKNYYRDTIRDVQSVEITLINGEMCDEVALYPYRYQSLGMYKWSLVGWLNKIIKGEGAIPFDEDDWLIMELKEAEDIFLENDENEKYELQKIDPIFFKNLPTQVYLNSKYFGYEEHFGFNWQYAQTFNFTSPIKEWKEKEGTFKPLTKDTFYQHNKGLIGAFENEFLPNLNFTFTELAKYLDMPEFSKDDFVQLIKLMIVLHDYGKLNDKWQKPMQHYQALKENVNRESFNEVLAHTCFDAQNKEDLNLAGIAGLRKRPSHAGVGAFIALTILGKKYKDKNSYLKILSPLATAIMRHHSSLSVSTTEYEVAKSNFNEFNKLYEEQIGFLDYKDFNKLLKFNPGKIEKYLVNSENAISFLMYFFFVRILRICDQKATENLYEYYNE